MCQPTSTAPYGIDLSMLSFQVLITVIRELRLVNIEYVNSDYKELFTVYTKIYRSQETKCSTGCQRHRPIILGKLISVLFRDKKWHTGYRKLVYKGTQHKPLITGIDRSH